MPTLTLSPTIQVKVKQYSEAHRAPVNKLLHFIGIPALIVAFLGLLSKLLLPAEGLSGWWRPNAAWIAILVAGACWIYWDAKIGVLVSAAFVGCYLIGALLPISVLVSMFAVGVIAHILGHRCFEGKPPALLSHPIALLEAPPWLLSIWLGLFRESREASGPQSFIQTGRSPLDETRTHSRENEQQVARQ